MQDILQKAKKKKSLNDPQTGDLWLKPSADEIIVWGGDEWITCTKPFSDTSEDYFRKKFEEDESELHKDNPQLKELWDEYKLLRRLSTGR